MFCFTADKNLKRSNLELNKEVILKGPAEYQIICY